MKIFKKTKKGFTLVELVVVIAVIAILAAVSVGAYFGVTESANNSKLEQEAKQVYTAIQTVALAPNEHSNLSKSGLEIKDTAEFEKALEGNLGFDVALTDEIKKDPSRPTIYFSDAAYSSAFGDKVYKTFTYLLPEIANKGAVADIVTGECRATESSAVEEELGDNDKEHFTASVVIAEYADAHGWADATQYESIEINENIYISAVGGGNTGKYYTSGENWRIYQNESPKIEIKGTTTDIVIKSVTISYNSEKTGTLIYNSNKVASNSEIVVNSNCATFGVGNTNENVGNGQVRITSINVNYYSDLTVDEPTAPPVDEVETVTSIEEALTAEVGTKAELTGTVCEIYVPWDNSTSTISFYITDENENKISVYNCSCSQEILLGDIVKVTGVIKVHNSKNQVSDNPSAEVTGHDSSYDYTITSIEEALSAVEGSKVCLEGEVVDIYQEYNSDYNNISVYIENSNGSKILAFRMTGNVSLHDKIIVTGSIDKHEGINQIGQGATFEDTNEDGDHRYSEATCEAPATCEVCGATTGSAAGHKDENSDGNCDVCTNPIDTALETILIKDYAGTKGWVDATKYLKIEGEHFTASTTSTNNSGKYYTNGNEWRIYQTESSEITISAKSGYKIVKVSVSYNIDKTGILTLNSSNIESDSEVNINANSVTFGVGNTSAGVTNGQVRITKLSVWYATDNETSVEPPVEPPHEHVYVEGKCECGVEDPNYQPPVDPDEYTEGWYLVKDASELGNGDKILITGKDLKYALSTNQKSSNRGATSINVSDECISTLPSDAQQITLEETGTKFAFKVENGYLYTASSSGNQLKTKTTLDVHGKWDITISNEVASIVATDSTNRKVMQYNYNNGSPLFACYASASQTALSIFKYYEDNGSTDTTTEPVTPTLSSLSLTSNISSLEPGDSITLNLSGKDTNGQDFDLSGKTVTWTYNSNIFEKTSESSTKLVLTAMNTVASNTADNVYATCNGVDSNKVSISISVPEQGGDVTPTTEDITINFGNTTQRISQDNNKQVWTNGILTFTNSKSKSQTNVSDYSNPVRLYDSSSITLAAQNSTISKIVFKCDESKYATALQDSLESINGITVTVKNTEVTIVLNSPTETFEISSLSAQVRLDSLTATCEKR